MMFRPDETGFPDTETELIRSRSARAAAERALIRVVHHYGECPEFVVLGGLVPELLCGNSRFQHAGTIDVDVQVDLEIKCGAVNSLRLERALRNAEFAPEEDQDWRWVSAGSESAIPIKFELLADFQGAATGATIRFDECESLGAINLHGTGYASRDVEMHELKAKIGGVVHRAEIKVSGLAGFLLAKMAAAHSRRMAKDWYDIAFVLLHNDAGGPAEAAEKASLDFADEIGAIQSALNDLKDNFSVPNAQGPQAYARQMQADHPGLDPKRLSADAIFAVEKFCQVLGQTRCPVV